MEVAWAEREFAAHGLSNQAEFNSSEAASSTL